MRRLTALAACALTLALPASATPPPPPDPIGEARPVIAQANADWAACIKTLDLDCLVKTYADDALFILPDGTTIVGKAAIRDLYAARGKSGSKIVTAEIFSQGIGAGDPTLVYEWGAGIVTTEAADGTQTTRTTTYLTVWRRTRDGHWQVSRNLVF